MSPPGNLSYVYTTVLLESTWSVYVKHDVKKKFIFGKGEAKRGLPEVFSFLLAILVSFQNSSLWKNQQHKLLVLPHSLPTHPTPPLAESTSVIKFAVSSPGSLKDGVIW